MKQALKQWFSNFFEHSTHQEVSCCNTGDWSHPQCFGRSAAGAKGPAFLTGLQMKMVELVQGPHFQNAARELSEMVVPDFSRQPGIWGMGEKAVE